MPDHIHVEINTSTIVKTVLVILFFVFLYILKDVLIIFLFALIIASAISPFANWLDEKGFPRLFGVLLLFLVILALVVAVLSLIIPYISQDISQLVTTLPQFVAKVSTSLEKVQQGSPQYLDFISEIQNILQGFSDYKIKVLG